MQKILLLSLIVCTPLLSQYSDRKSDLVDAEGIFPEAQRIFPKSSENTLEATPGTALNLSASDFKKFPYETPNRSYTETFPLFLNSGQLLLFWTRYDSLFYARSTDVGQTWNAPSFACVAFSPVNTYALQTSSGRIIVVFRSAASSIRGIRKVYSDDGGTTWSGPDTISTTSGDGIPVLTESINGKLWCSYSRSSATTLYDLYYKTSVDNGKTWSEEIPFLTDTTDSYYLTIVPGDGTNITAIYQSNASGNYDIYKKTSANGGTSWSFATPILNTPLNEGRPRYISTANGTRYILFQKQNPTSIKDYVQPDIYYIKSTDNGVLWTSLTRLTNYAGTDAAVNVATSNNQVFISFYSSRWESRAASYSVTGPSLTLFMPAWFGVIGLQEDTDPPPAILNYQITTPAATILDTVRAFIDDETGVGSVSMTINLGGAPQSYQLMYDDGTHGDLIAGDRIYSAVFGPVKVGDRISFVFSFSDTKGNLVTLNAPGFEAAPVHNAGNLILSFHTNSQMGEAGYGGKISAYWPKQEGDEYLYVGGLWVGGTIDGIVRVSNYDKMQNESDWTQTPGTSIKLQSGISDLDGDVYYDDRFAPNPFPMSVHQQSYQWADPSKDDFIIFQYTISYTGSSPLEQVSTTVWLDPDVGNAGENLAGYDEARKLVYMYNSGGVPTGHFGLKLLGTESSVATVFVYQNGVDPSSDPLRFEAMHKGVAWATPFPADYRMLLTAQYFTLPPNSQKSIAFGLVMGENLQALQQNADTMEATFKAKVVTRIVPRMSSPVPQTYELSANYPNPFNSMTRITYQISQPSHVKMQILNLLGQEVAVLVEGIQVGGRFVKNWDAGNYPSGIYFCRLSAQSISGDGKSFIAVRKIVLLK